MKIPPQLSDFRSSRAARHIAIFLLALVILINLGFVFATKDKLLDFGSFLAAGQNARRGLNPYDSSSPLIFRVDYPQLGIGGSLVNLNPPISILFFSLIPDTHALAAATLWRAASVCIYLLSVYLIGGPSAGKPAPARYIWALSLAGFWHTIQLGQIYAPLLLLLACGLILERRGKPVLAGILIGGILAIKPNFVIWVLMLAAARKWRLSLGALGSFAALSLLPALVYGPAIYLEWLRASRLDERILAMAGNNSLAGLTVRFGSFEAGLGIAAALVLVCLVLIARMAPSGDDGRAHELGILLALLSSPISWTGYTILLLPLFFARRVWPPALACAAAILAVPFVVPLLLFDNSRFNFVFWGWLYGWPLLILLAQALWDSNLLRLERGKQFSREPAPQP